MSRKQKAIEEKYRNSKPKGYSLPPKKEAFTFQIPQKPCTFYPEVYEKYLNLIAKGEVSVHEWYNEEYFVVRDHKHRSMCYVNDYNSEHHSLKKAWDDYHNSPLMAAL